MSDSIDQEQGQDQETVRVLHGTVTRLFHQSPTFCAGRMLPVRSEVARPGEISFAGRVYVREGEAVCLKGKWVDHDRFGRQFSVSERILEDAISPDGLAAWLSVHGSAHGIGPSRARKIAAAFGDNFAGWLRDDPERIAIECGVPLESVRQLAKHWEQHEELNKVGVQLARLELTANQIHTLCEKFKGSIVALLDENPYLLVGECPGLGFKRVDGIAQKIGVPPQHPGRIDAAIKHVLREEESDGNTCLERGRLADLVAEVLTDDSLGMVELIEHRLAVLLEDEDVRSEKDPAPANREYIALPRLWKYERAVYDFLVEARRPSPHFPDEQTALDALAGNTRLDDSQRRAAVLALTRKACLISGGAGTGKSTLIAAIANACRAADLKVSLAAPTGKAARRLEEVAPGFTASTIHRLLAYQPGTGFGYNRGLPLPFDVVIVDECSMADIEISYFLFDAVGPKTTVVLVGDHHQLPPVGPGALLRDAIHHELLPMSILANCHRQAGALKLNCQEILAGKVLPTVVEADVPSGEKPPWFVARKLHTPEAVLGHVEKLFSDVLVNRLGYDPVADIQFLTPIHAGPLGTRALNVLLQRLYQASIGVEVDKAFDPEKRPKLYQHDKVIQTKNNYALDIMNGNQGRVLNVSPLIVDFDGREIAIPKDCAGEIELAYCLTPHKCIHPDTLVETPEGLMPIGDLQGSGIIATPDGPKSYRSLVSNPSGPGLEITTEDGYSITVTPDHKVEAWIGNRHELIEAACLKEGTFLRLRLGVTCDPKAGAILPVAPEGDIRAVGHSFPERVTPEVAEFFGLMVADGTVTPHGLRLFKRHEEVIDRFAFLAKKLFLANPIRSSINETDGYYVNSCLVSKWLLKIGGMGPNAKGIPQCILRSPLDCQAAFLRGLFEDGTVNVRGDNQGHADHIEFTTCYGKMGSIVQTMLLRFGVISALTRSGNISRVYIYGQNIARFAESIGFISEFKKSRLCLSLSKETRYRVPVGRRFILDIRKRFPGVVDKFTYQNARDRGFITREVANRIKDGIADDAVKSHLSYVLSWHHSRVKSIRETSCESMCVEVPCGHRFLQAGFSFGNSQGSEFPCAVVICHKLHSFMTHRNWLYTACTRARQTCVILGDPDGIERAATRLVNNQRRTLLPVFARQETEKAGEGA